MRGVRRYVRGDRCVCFDNLWDGRQKSRSLNAHPHIHVTTPELPPLPPPPTPAAQQPPPNARLKALDNTCALLGGSAANGDEYWSYEWCHRKEIRQFHYGMPAQPEGQVRAWRGGGY